MNKTKKWGNVRTITVVTEPEPEGPIIKLGVGAKEITDVIYISPKEVQRIRVQKMSGKYEADFRLTEKMGIHGKFAYVPLTPLTCRIDKKMLLCSIPQEKKDTS